MKCLVRLTSKATQATGGGRYEMLGQTVTGKATQATVGGRYEMLGQTVTAYTGNRWG